MPDTDKTVVILSAEEAKDVFRAIIDLDYHEGNYQYYHEIAEKILSHLNITEEEILENS